MTELEINEEEIEVLEQRVVESFNETLITPDTINFIGAITNSMRGTLMDCPRRFFLEYVMRLTPTSEAVFFKWGSLVHKVCENLKKALMTDIDGVVKETIEHYRETIKKEFESGTRTLKDLAIYEEMFLTLPKAVDGWILQYGKEIHRYESYQAETKFAVDLPNGWKFKGMIDDIVIDTVTGDLAIWEIKTAAQTGDMWWDSLALDTQAVGYQCVARHFLGLPVKYSIYDVWKKPQCRLKKHETPMELAERVGNAYLVDHAKYFERRCVHKKASVVEGYVQELVEIAELITFYATRGIWPMHHPRNRMGGCTYLPLCLKHRELETLDLTNKGMYYIRDAKILNPELDVVDEINED